MCSISWLSIAALIWVARMSVGTQATEPSEAQDMAEWKKLVAESGPLYDEGRFTEAALALQKAIHCAEHFAALDRRLPVTIHALGFIYQKQGKYSQAAGLYLRAIQLWQKIGPSEDDALLKSVDNLLGTYIASHDYRAARKLMARRFPETPQSTANWKYRATLLNMRAGLAYIVRQYREADLLFRQSLILWEQHAPDENRNVAIVRMNVARVLSRTKRYEEALDIELNAMDLLEKLDATAGPLVVRSLFNSALFSVRLRRLTDAERYYRRSLALAKQVFGPEHPVSGEIMLRYSVVLRTLHRTAEGKAMATEAQAILGKSQKGDTVDVLELAPMR
jgi:tetratricopeptide (TPR) repeat protein